MRSSTLPTKLSSRASEVSVDEDVDILIYVFVAFTHCYGVSRLEKNVSGCIDRWSQLRYKVVAFRRKEYVYVMMSSCTYNLDQSFRIPGDSFFSNISTAIMSDEFYECLRINNGNQ